MAEIPVAKVCPAWMSPEVCGELLNALALCEASMDTAGMFGVQSVLAPAYRDSWEKAHSAALAVLAKTFEEHP
jgi:hypothetical protein